MFPYMKNNSNNNSNDIMTQIQPSTGWAWKNLRAILNTIYWKSSQYPTVTILIMKTLPTGIRNFVFQHQRYSINWTELEFLTWSFLVEKTPKFNKKVDINLQNGRLYLLIWEFHSLLGYCQTGVGSTGNWIYKYTPWQPRISNDAFSRDKCFLK